MKIPKKKPECKTSLIPESRGSGLEYEDPKTIAKILSAKFQTSEKSGDRDFGIFGI